MKCSRCAHDNRDGRRFCAECGASLALACPSCGFSNEPGEKFCGGCGARLGAAATPARTAFSSPETYTPRHLAEKILTSRSALEGERKQVTVLFADMKGSMELLADRDPEEVEELIQREISLSLGLAYCHFLLGRRDEGMRVLPPDRNLWEASSGPWRRTVSRYGILMANAYLAAGLPDDAQEALAPGLALSSAENARAYLVPLGRLRAETLVALDADGDRAGAAEWYRRSLTLAEELGMRPELARCHGGLGTLLRRGGALDEARAHLTTAAAMYRDMDMPFWLEQIDKELRHP